MALTRGSVKGLFSAAFQTRAYSAPADRAIPAAKQKYVPTTGTYPKGFLAGSSHAGVKPSNTQHDDIAMVVSETPCVAAAVFTQNLFKAAPVLASKRILASRQSQDLRGVIINSGCANAVTGAHGEQDALAMARTADGCLGEGLGADKPSTLIMSTGVIGQRLPIDKITEAIPKAHSSLGSKHENWMSAAKAICTTDTFPKLLSRTFTLPSHPNVEYSIAGMTKGAGMIHPNMATLLGVICTDAKIDPDSSRRMLRHCNNGSFNCITIDGDTSTNDTVALFANGAAAPPDTNALKFTNLHRDNTVDGEDTRAFIAVLKTFMTDLAKLVVRDGEGATKFVTVRVKSEKRPRVAKAAATSIATSSLVKTALYGKDANWGRVLCAIGYAPGIMDTTQDHPDNKVKRAKSVSSFRQMPSHTSVLFVPADGSPELKLLVRGEPQTVDEERAKEILEMEDLEISVNLADRDLSHEDEKISYSEAVVWTCDFSHEYVTINGDYRT